MSRRTRELLNGFADRFEQIAREGREKQAKLRAEHEAAKTTATDLKFLNSLEGGNNGK